MTVSSATTRVSFTGNGSTTAFSTSPMQFFNEGELDVYLVTTATGAAVLQTITTHYTVSGGAGSTGTVTMVTAPASTETLVIVRDTARTQATDFVNNDASDAEVTEDALDKLTMIAQESFARAASRALRQPDSDAADIEEIPDAVTRANKYLTFDADGNPDVTASTSGGASVTSNAPANPGPVAVVGTGTAAARDDHVHRYQSECIAIACSDETTALTTGTAKATFRMPYAFTLTAVRASVTTAPTGATRLAVDINESGTTILSTKLTFDASEKTTTTSSIPPVISDTALADDAEITIDIDAIGSTIAGAGLKVYLIGRQSA